MEEEEKEAWDRFGEAPVGWVGPYYDSFSKLECIIDCEPIPTGAASLLRQMISKTNVKLDIINAFGQEKKEKERMNRLDMLEAMRESRGGQCCMSGICPDARGGIFKFQKHE